MRFLAAKKFEWQNGAAKEEHSNVAQVVEQRLLQGEQLFVLPERLSDEGSQAGEP